TLTTEDPSNPTKIINLGGGYQQEPEGPNELALWDMARALGFRTIIGDVPNANFMPSGEELIAYQWKILDTTKPIYVRQITVSHSVGQTATVRIRDYSDNSSLLSVTHDDLDSQAFLPLKSNSTLPAEAVLSAANAIAADTFYFEIGSYRSCDAPYNPIPNQPPPACPAGQTHGLRVWPARDPQGVIITGVFVFAMDYVSGGAGNYDFNDNFFLVTNVQANTLPYGGESDMVWNEEDTAPIFEQVATPLLVGQTRTLTFEVYNRTLVGSNNSNTKITLPEGLTYVSDSNPFCTGVVAIGNDVLTCTFGSNFLGIQLIDITVAADSAGVYTIGTQISTDDANEFRTSNNKFVPDLQITVEENAAGATQTVEAALTQTAGAPLTETVIAATTTGEAALTQTAAPTATATPSETPTDTATPSPSYTPGGPTITPTYTPTETETPTVTLTASETYTPSPSYTPGGPTITPTYTPTETLSVTLTPSPTGDGATATATSLPLLNLVTNGSFEIDDNLDKVPDGWTPKNLTGDKRKCNKESKPAVAFEGVCAFQFKGGLGEASKITQKPDFSALLIGDTLTLHAAVTGKGIVLGEGKIAVKIKYTDSTKLKITIEVPAGDTLTYTQLAKTDTITLAIASLKIDLSFKGLSGKYIVDAVQVLVNEPQAPVLRPNAALLPLPPSQ
ncbi:MAG: hypothetical protein H7Y11_04135, partial [Armatimonadetes bacterium]|nr:hypothetical protein [Anaerolineae bacterium]